MGAKTYPTPAKIKATRLAAGKTQSEAAKIVDVSLRTWQNWESDIPANQRKMRPFYFDAFLKHCSK